MAEREGATGSLEAAVAAYLAALTEQTRDRVPLQWAAIHTNLGTALQALGERDGKIELLWDAVTAYRSALEEQTREREPLDWAMTHTNLGTALLSPASA